MASQTEPKNRRKSSTKKATITKEVTSKKSIKKNIKKKIKKNVSWMRRHFAWVLPSNLGESRFSYSDKLKLQINSNKTKQPDSSDDDEKVVFKPWLNRKDLKHKDFTELYNDLRKGITWKENSFSHYFQLSLECIVFILLSPLLIILMSILYSFIIITRVIGPFISSCFGSFEYSETTVIDKESGVQISTKYSTFQNHRFAVYRLTQYVYWVTVHLFKVLSRLIVGKQQIPLVKDEQLVVYMHSNQHTRFDYDENNNIIGGYIDNSDVIDVAEHNLYKGRYFPIKKIHLDYKTNILSFTLNGYGEGDDKVISNKPGDCSVKVWNAIKANYMSQRCIMDTLTHSWVHFYFSDIAAKHLYKYFGHNPDTVLGRLLHSHFLYTTVVNMAGAGDGFNQPQIFGDVDSLINTLNPVKANPMKRDGAVAILVTRIKEHYFKNDNYEKIDEDMFPPPFVKQRLKMFNPNNYKTVRGYSLYWDMVSDYYLSVYQFINNLDEQGLIDREELRGYISKINEEMNGLSKCDEINVLCTLIWTNAFIHGTDHITYYNIFKNFPLMACYNKLNVRNNNNDINITSEAILHSWSSCWISFKSEIFINTFTKPTGSCLNCIADYSASPNLYRKFKNIPSLKTNGKLKTVNNIHDEYLRSINKVSDKYDWMIHVNEIDASISY